MEPRTIKYQYSVSRPKLSPGVKYKRKQSRKYSFVRQLWVAIFGAFIGSCMILIALRSRAPSIEDQPTLANTQHAHSNSRDMANRVERFRRRPPELEALHELEKRDISRYTHKQCTNDTTILKMLLTDNKYNKHRLPASDGVEVRVEFWVQEVSSVSEQTSEFEMDIYINELWIDPGLRYEHLSPCKNNITLGEQVLKKIWTPNSCFINSKKASIHDSPFKNIFLMIYPNGTVWVDYRVKVTGPCDMDLTKFPMDAQTCSLVYESFNYNMDEVRIKWMNIPEPVYPLKKINLPDYDLLDIETKYDEVDYPAGKWIELTVIFTFQRRCVWYFLQAYIPTYLTIFLSWVSFTLGVKAIPARTMLGVNSLLAMMFQFGTIMRNLPRVSYVKAIDVWMLACMTFIFASLLELAIIGYLTKELLHPPTKRPPPDDKPKLSTKNSTILLETNENYRQFQTREARVRKFPSIFRRQSTSRAPGPTTTVVQLSALPPNTSDTEDVDQRLVSANRRALIHRGNSRRSIRLNRPKHQSRVSASSSSQSVGYAKMSHHITRPGSSGENNMNHVANSYDQNSIECLGDKFRGSNENSQQNSWNCCASEAVTEETYVDDFDPRCSSIIRGSGFTENPASKRRKRQLMRPKLTSQLSIWSKMKQCWGSFHLNPERIDQVAAIGFPLTFSTFNIVYWSYYNS